MSGAIGSPDDQNAIGTVEGRKGERKGKKGAVEKRKCHLAGGMMGAEGRRQCDGTKRKDRPYIPRRADAGDKHAHVTGPRRAKRCVTNISTNKTKTMRP